MLQGVFLSRSNFTYEGSILNNEPHGKGTFIYANNDKYIGDCKFGKFDGFGIYEYSNGAKYTGFFSYGRFHGIGTFEDDVNVYKGTWRNDRKHGQFIKTCKETFETYQQQWRKGRLQSSTKIQYIQPLALLTIRNNPRNLPKKQQVRYKNTSKKCIGCCDNDTNATNSSCGHVAMCHVCLLKCDSCPICRAPIDTIIKLFLS